MPIKSLFIIHFFLINFHLFSQKLNEDGIEYLDEEIWQQGSELGSSLDFEGLVDINGVPLIEDQFSDKIVVVKFWFIGCRGCKQEEKYVRQVTNHFRDEPSVQFVSISMSSGNKIAKYYEKNGDFGYRTVSMKRKDIEERYKVITSPTHWFFKNGKLVDKVIGPIYSPAAKEWMINYITELQM